MYKDFVFKNLRLNEIKRSFSNKLSIKIGFFLCLGECCKSRPQVIVWKDLCCQDEIVAITLAHRRGRNHRTTANITSLILPPQPSFGQFRMLIVSKRTLLTPAGAMKGPELKVEVGAFAAKKVGREGSGFLLPILILSYVHISHTMARISMIEINNLHLNYSTTNLNNFFLVSILIL